MSGCAAAQAAATGAPIDVPIKSNGCDPSVPTIAASCSSSNANDGGRVEAADKPQPARS